MTSAITTYLRKIENSLSTGITTEHSFRGDLAELFEALENNIHAINEPQRIACGAPDLAILRDRFMVGHVEAKDIGAPLNTIANDEQIKRYRGALENLILTDYLAFQWYLDGELHREVRLARRDQQNKLRLENNGKENLAELLSDFLAHQPQPISSPQALAERLARLTHLIRDVIIRAFEENHASDTLTGWRNAFARILIPDLDQEENLGQFADMFAQTLAYGLFSARVMHQAGDFDRASAQGYIPRTNPFLRQFFTFITGPDLDEEPYGGYVNDLIQVLALADMSAILADFGQRTGGEDPMVHFYETFLAAYDPDLRERRGVYYTPMPVVSFIVRSVDSLLKSHFNLPQGLASTQKLPDGTHKVLVLDPAVGTATFLYAVIDLIREDFMARDNAGMWSGYVREHLLPRIFGFEIMMAPYAVAHFKLALQLAGHDLPDAQQEKWAYDFQADDRIGIYLTNTLEIAEDEPTGLYGPMRFVSEEARAADAVKQEKPIMVVLGNPPYSVSSSNKSDYIESLMETYKAAVRDERNIQPLSDDYIKFIRFAHDRIERTGAGVVAMITNNIFLSGLIHRGIREELIKSFDEIYIVNLHGNSIVKETTPEGEPDHNVFDIRQGVAITILVKTQQTTKQSSIFYSDIWGSREIKYSDLYNRKLFETNWMELNPQPPFFLLVTMEFIWFKEYEQYVKVNDLLNSCSSGIKSHRDHFVVDIEKTVLEKRIKKLEDDQITNVFLEKEFQLTDTKTWQLEKARIAESKEENTIKKIILYHYRPFDNRWLFYSSNFVERNRFYSMQQVMKNDVSLIFGRAGHVVQSDIWNLLFLSSGIIDTNIFYRGGGIIFPLYLYPEEQPGQLFDNTATSPWPPDPAHDNRVPNLDKERVDRMAAKLGLVFDPLLAGRTHTIEDAFGPEDLLAYTYAVFHSPTYRERYAEFLKIDFPRLPLTSDASLFRHLVFLGRELISLHLMEAPQLNKPITNYPITGDNQVAPRGGYPKYVSPNDEHKGRVFINREQYFEGVSPEVWAFEIGGYQVLHKWLKDRRGRTLDFEDLTHYQKVVVALSETMRLMTEIDAAIPGWPLD